METIIQSIWTGASAALVAAFVLEFASYIRRKLNSLRSIKHIREILEEGRDSVLTSKNEKISNPSMFIPKDVVRVGEYNRMIRKLDVALNEWRSELSFRQKKEIIEALNWYHTDTIFASKEGEEIKFKEFPDGKWTHNTMYECEAKYRFEKLKSITWLKFGEWKPPSVE